MDQLSSLIFSKYKEVHGDFSQSDDNRALQREFDLWGKLNYLPLIKSRSKDISIFEVGTYLGHNLKWLKSMGFTNLHGIELDPISCKIGQKYSGVQDIQSGDVMDYLSLIENKFDLIIMKAVLEHIERNEVPRLLSLLHKSLRPGGQIIITVPNMDWLLAGHERYMDATHRMGFTRESLGAVMRLYFSNVEVEPFDTQTFQGRHGFYRKHIRQLILKVIHKIFRYLGEGLDELWFEYRAIKGTGYKHG